MRRCAKGRRGGDDRQLRRVVRLHSLRLLRDRDRRAILPLRRSPGLDHVRLCGLWGLVRGAPIGGPGRGQLRRQDGTPRNPGGRRVADVGGDVSDRGGADLRAGGGPGAHYPGRRPRAAGVLGGRRVRRGDVFHDRVRPRGEARPLRELAGVHPGRGGRSRGDARGGSVVDAARGSVQRLGMAHTLPGCAAFRSDRAVPQAEVRGHAALQGRPGDPGDRARL